MYIPENKRLFYKQIVQSGRQIGEVLHCFRNGEDAFLALYSSPVTDLPFLNRENSGSRYPSPAILTVKKNVPDQQKYQTTIVSYRIEVIDEGFTSKEINPVFLTCRYLTTCIILHNNFSQTPLPEYIRHWKSERTDIVQIRG